MIEAGLDWKVLEKGVDSAEINLLRSKVSIGEAKGAELEAKRAEIEELEEIRRAEREALHKLRSQAKLGLRYGIVAAILFGIGLAAVAVAVYRANEMRETADIARASANFARASAVRECMETEKLRDLLAKVNEQSAETQRKLDEIIRQNQVTTPK